MKTQQILEMIEQGNNITALAEINKLTGHELNEPTNSGNSLLLHVARLGNADFIKAIAKTGCDFEQRWRQPLSTNASGAVSQSYIDELLAGVLDDAPAEPEVVTQNDIENLLAIINEEPDRDSLFVGYTALDISMWEGFEAATMALVRAGANCKKANRDGYFPLGSVLSNKWYGVAEAMLENGADPHELDSFGQTLWHMAAGLNNSHLTNLASKFNCDPNRARKDNTYPLHSAASAGNLECLKILITAGADIFKRSADFNTALGIAVVNDRIEMIDFLEKKAALAEYTDDSGNTLLHYAAWNGQETFCRYLLNHGQSIDAENNQGDTALGQAVLNGHVDACRVLLDSGADPKHMRKSGQTILEMAQARGRKSIIAIIAAQIRD